MKFKKIDGPYGIPIYLEYIPDVRSVSMSWTMFVGSADDESVGMPGLYHWFEHIPFRGTTQYPGGYRATKGATTQHGGDVGAYTSMHATTYHAHVPADIWREAFSTITDLMARPLISDEAISAERDIIVQEIAKKKSSLRSFVAYTLPEIVWQGHPYGHPVLGSEQSLRMMTPEMLRSAHALQYDRSRCALVISGTISETDVLSEMKKLADRIPNHGLSVRTSATFHGPLPPWHAGKVTYLKTDYPSSAVLMLFPLPPQETLQQKFQRSVADRMFDFGGLDSPMYRVLREERNLVYTAEVIEHEVPGGGYWGIYAETQTKNVEAVIAAIKHLLNDPEILSESRLRTVQMGLRGAFDMRPISPAKHREYAVQRLINTGVVYSDDEYLERVAASTIEDVRHVLRGGSIGDAHTIVFCGKSDVSLL
ncbi:MAG TPA: pitrilysin family protein [Candidatus Paceibacterota bacterium]